MYGIYLFTVIDFICKDMRMLFLFSNKDYYYNYV